MKERVGRQMRASGARLTMRMRSVPNHIRFACAVSDSDDRCRYSC